MERQEFKRQLDELGRIILEGIAYFTVWHGLVAEDEDTAKALNRYRGLFLPAQIGLKWMTLLQFSKVFDRHSKAISLSNLLTVAKQNPGELIPHATKENLRDIEQKIENSKDLLTRLKRVRDKRIAHHDAIIAGDTHLLYGETRKLVEEVKSMYNSLTIYYDRSSTIYDFFVREAERHTSQVVDIIRKEKDRAIRRIKKLDTAT